MIESFKVDHENLNRGIYLSKVQNVNGTYVITYDIRVRAPYKDRTMSEVCAHSIEHLMATSLEDVFKSVELVDRIYFGPMGCMTGFYLVVASATEDIHPLVCRLIVKAIDSLPSEIPARSKKECGNFYTLIFSNEVKETIKAMRDIVYNARNQLDTYSYLK